MFTGIIQAVGQIASVASLNEDVCLTVVSEQLDFSDVSAGDSIAINGVCLTVVTLQPRGFTADVSSATLACTTLSSFVPGQAVNLEKALLATTRLGGHMVSGHVDGIAEVSLCQDEGRSRRIEFRVATALTHYIACKGSVCIDGVSLTVNDISGDNFSVNIIPHTQQKTVIDHYQPGYRVNLEVDIIARYLERLLLRGEDNMATEGEGIQRKLLVRAGFIPQ